MATRKQAEPHTRVAVANIPNCDIEAAHGPAYADAKLNFGPWAYVCKACFTRYECKLGLGAGQELVTESTTTEKERSK
jgi:hypothetical protein